MLDFVKNILIYIFGQGFCVKKVDFLNEKDIDNFTDKGIIVALGVQVFSEVKETVINMVEAEHFLLLNC